jgi:hypothetical protein
MCPVRDSVSRGDQACLNAALCTNWIRCGAAELPSLRFPHESQEWLPLCAVAAVIIAEPYNDTGIHCFILIGRNR